jgi:hemolysin activation/secretion protein
VRRADLERAALIIGDMPGAALPVLNMGPGQKPGATDFFAEVPRGKRFGGYLTSDNMGSRYTGRWRFGAGADVNSPLGLADKLSVFGLTTDTRGLTTVGVNYAFPLHPDGLRLDLGYSHVYYELGDDFEDMKAHGTADIFQGTFSYPLIRSGSRNLVLSLNIAHKRMEDRYDVFEVRERSESTLGKLRLEHEAWGSVFGMPLHTKIGGGVTYGRFHMPSEAERDMDFRETEGAFGYAALDAAANLALSENWSFGVTASGQKAFGKNLDSSEQFGVTGFGGVKAYREVISGDNGYLLNAELKYRLPGAGKLEHWLGAFVDQGGWNYEKSPYPEKRMDSLTDIGLGYYLTCGPFSARVQLAQGLGDYPSELKKESQTTLAAFFSLSF